MKRSAVRRSGRVNRVALVVVAVALLSLGVLGYVLRDKLIGPGPARTGNQDDAASRAAFLEAYQVFMHPRCMNCHPSGDVPLQGDDSHLHAQNVQRGAGGKGKYALKCGNCHQDTNLPRANMPPGNPNWHLPKTHIPFAFKGKSPRRLADTLKDPKLNGGKTLEH